MQRSKLYTPSFLFAKIRYIEFFFEIFLLCIAIHKAEQKKTYVLNFQKMNMKMSIIDKFPISQVFLAEILNMD